MIYYLYNLYYTLFFFYPKFISNLIFIIIVIILNIYLILFYKTILEEYTKFSDRTNITMQKHINPLNNQSIYIPLDYKIYDIKYTIINNIYYTLICILPFFILRILRLGNEIDLIKYFKIISKLQPIIIIIFVITIISFILFFVLFWLNIYSRFYKEIKKMYIYTTQFGGCLDVINFNKNKEPYIFTYLLNPLNRITYEKLNLKLYEIIENFQINLKKESYIINKEITQLVIYSLKLFKLSIPLLYKYSIYIVISMIILLELYQNNFVTKKISYALLCLFLYKQFYNIIYFSWYHNINFDKTIALYYYKLTDLTKKDNKNIRQLRIFYAVNANYEKNDKLLHYINTGLNLHKAEALKNNRYWPEYTAYYKKFLKDIKYRINWKKD